MTKFRLLFGLDVAISLMTLYFLYTLTTVPTYVPFDRAPWVLILSGFAAVLVGAVVLHRRGRPRLAIGVLLIPAIPAVLGGLGLVWLMVLFSVAGAHS